jgi:hypothetical protein
MESMKNVFRFVVGSLAVAGVLALFRGWSKVPDYLLMIVGMAIVWAVSGLIREWIRKRRSNKGP